MPEYDIFAKCNSGAGNFQTHGKNDDHYLISPFLEGPVGPHMGFQGKPMIIWSINDYLGFAQHPDIKQAALDSVEQWSTTMPMGSMLMTGTTQMHLEIEQRFASFTQKEAVMLSVSGYLGVIGVITGLVGVGDTVIIDQHSHACMVDGAFLAAAKTGAKIKPYKHNNLADLERQLKAAREESDGGILIVTEGVFSMHGDTANLPEICAIKERYGARVLVDDAHGFGIMGAHGRGTAEHLGVQDKIDIYITTFAKCMVSIGGVTCGPKTVIDYLRRNARPTVFSKAMPLVLVGAVTKTLELLENAHDRREKAWSNARLLQEGLCALGYTLEAQSTVITSINLPSLDIGVGILRALRDEYGVFVSVVTAPVVPPGVTLIRMVPTAAHSKEDVEKTLFAYEECRKRFF